MALFLTSFPIEVLAQITFYLTDVEVLMKLPMCGDSKLTAKLKSGGVTHLNCQLSTFAVGLVKFAQSLRLHSLDISHLVCAEQLRELVYGASSTIKHLDICVDDTDALLSAADFELESEHFVARSTTKRPWIVSSTFPELESLSIDSELGSVLKDIAFFATWLRGLPPTLTKLRLPRKFNLGNQFSIWPHLPPNVTHLGRIFFVPSYAPRRPLVSIQSLKLRSSIGETDSQTYSTPENHVTDDWGTGMSNLSIEASRSSDKFSHFPNLTRLSLWDTALPSAFPPRLTSLKLNTAERNLFVILALVPRTITFLSLKRFIFDNPIRMDTLSTYAPTFNLLKTFKLDITMSDANDADVDPCGEQIISKLIGHLPNVEYLSISHSKLGPIHPSHLSLLNGSTLHTLKASIDRTCFNLSENGRSCFEMEVPKLHTLTVNRLEGQAPSFSIIPPSVTKLSAKTIWDTNSLPLLPSTVKHFKAEVAVRGDDDLVALFSDPRPSSTELAAQTTSSDVNVPLQGSVLRKLSISKAYHLERLEKSFMKDRSSDVVLVPCSSEKPQIELTWLHIHSYPTTLTELTFSSLPKYLFDHLASLITPSNLPLLQTLHVGNNQLPLDIDLAGFTLLRSLQLSNLEASMPLSCPPNLTELISQAKLILPAGFLPLPLSITHLESSEAVLEPLTALAPLINLKTLKAVNNNAGFMDVIELLPPTMTRLDLYGTNLTAEQCKLLHARCPDLRKVSANNSFALPQLADLHDNLPEAKLKAKKLDLSDLDIIASRAGFSHGSLIIPDGMVLAEWALGMLGVAFPRRKTDIWAHRVKMSTDQISRFCKFLSPSMLSLNLDWAMEAIPTHDLPRWLTKLVVQSSDIPFTSDAVANLPPALKTLEVSVIEPKDVALLPNGLTSLVCAIDDDHEPEEDPAILIRWPTSLTHLEIKSSHGIHPKQFDNLPPTLTSLSIRDCPSRYWDHLPSSLKFLQTRSSSQDLFGFLAKRRITWITIPPAANSVLRRSSALFKPDDREITSKT